MSQVKLTVGGRKYTVACAAGEEDRVASLGAEVDGKLHQLGKNLAPQEAQNLLFAALLLADELRETNLALDKEREAATLLKTEADDVRARLAEAQDAIVNVPATQPLDGPDLAQALEHVAQMLENCAEKLEGTLENNPANA